MFTGIVEEAGTLLRSDENKIVVGASTVLEETKVGDSISVNGCCLTVTDRGGDWWSADVSEETRRRTAIGQLRSGDKVNLERAARIGGRLDGHLVQGHVDCVGEVVAGPPDLRVGLPTDRLKYVVVKGSIAVDGVSLTVVNLYDDGFDVALIPHTLEHTTLSEKRPGDKVNIEVDLIAKYVERLLAPS